MEVAVAADALAPVVEAAKQVVRQGVMAVPAALAAPAPAALPALVVRAAPTALTVTVPARTAVWGAPGVPIPAGQAVPAALLTAPPDAKTAVHRRATQLVSATVRVPATAGPTP